MKRFDLNQIQTVVIKFGSSLVTNEGHGVDIRALSAWAKQIATIRAKNIQVILVSSGAIAEGMKRLGWTKRPQALHELQAAAAVGQMGLAQAYEEAFLPLGIQTAQILLTHDDLSDRTRYLNARSTLRTLLNNHVIPIINENDTVTTDEIKLGDNDTLGALVTNLIEADALIILTDQDGLFDCDPRHHPEAKKIGMISANHPELLAMAGGAGSQLGTGGMYTKVKAAQRAALSGAVTYIASGFTDDILMQLWNGHHVGTLFTPDRTRLTARQQWMMGQIQISGNLVVDAGAARALKNNHSSLLPVGCIDVDGCFNRGALVVINDESGHPIARGLVNYSSHEIKKLCREPSKNIISILGYMVEDELVHRDNMVILN